MERTISDIFLILLKFHLWLKETLGLFANRCCTFLPLGRVTIFELFCLQNSLIVGVQPQVSGKVGSLVGSFLGGQCSAFPTTVEFYRKASCRGRNKNADENARKILLLKRHYESVLISFAWCWIFIYQIEMAGFLVVDFLRKRIVSTNLVYTWAEASSSK